MPKWKIAGYATLYNVVDNLDEVTEPGCIKQVRSTLTMLWLHEPSQIIGYWTKLHYKARGLWAEGICTIDPTDFGLSIGYNCRQQKHCGKIIRLLDICLWEISLTPFPALPACKIEIIEEC